ncbi:hypothetical protein KUCAC02_033020, partial [Chaenocephalus aceratus]
FRTCAVLQNVSNICIKPSLPSTVLISRSDELHQPKVEKKEDDTCIRWRLACLTGEDKAKAGGPCQVTAKMVQVILNTNRNEGHGTHMSCRVPACIYIDFP